MEFTPIFVVGRSLTADEMTALAGSLFANPAQGEKNLRKVRQTIDPDALDLFLSEMVTQVEDAAKAGLQPWAIFKAAGLAGARRTAQALREIAPRYWMNAFWVLEALLAIENVRAIGFCADLARKGLFSYNNTLLEHEIDRICTRFQVSPEERELRSLSTDAAKTKPAAAALEKLFLGGFSWDEQSFREAMLDHPLLFPIAQQLVWGELEEHGMARNLFRVDAARNIRPRFPVVIAHPAQMEPSELQHWKQAGLKPPFAQLTRPCVRLGDAALPQRAIGPSELIAGLDARGWTRATYTQGCLREHWREFPHLKLKARITYSGVPVVYGGEWNLQRIEDVTFEQGGASQPFAAAHPLAVSSVFTDLRAISGEN